MGIASLILGIIGILICWIPLVGFLSYILVVVGLILGIVSLCKKSKTQGKKGVSIAGIIVCGIAIPIIIFVSTIISLGTLIFVTAQDGIINENNLNNMRETLEEISANEYYREYYDDYYDSIYDDDIYDL